MLMIFCSFKWIYQSFIVVSNNVIECLFVFNAGQKVYIASPLKTIKNIVLLLIKSKKMYNYKKTRLLKPGRLLPLDNKQTTWNIYAELGQGKWKFACIFFKGWKSLLNSPFLAYAYRLNSIIYLVYLSITCQYYIPLVCNTSSLI
jgi:hypothetical protein